MNDYRSRLAKGRELAGMTLKDLAEALGVSLQNVSQVERGKQSMTVERLLQTCAVLRLRTEWVLHGTGPMFVGGSVGKRPAKRA
ncbi:helix-turn-helix transcriptional regulator [Hymenobacter koreensis]|uniref:HTH cro/C1-type domain-containing protein n=1 Tax=Hymenobacter koreensis TaxID=1084523 RepID=A0ABP8JN83_9BACT